MYNRFYIRVLCLLLLASPLAQADKLAFSADYKANIKGFGVSATRALKTLDSGQYELSFKASSWAATLDESSQFSLKSGQIEPQRYSYKQSALGKKKSRSLSFDRLQQSITSTEQDQSQAIANTNNLALDKLNYQLQLQLDLRAGKEQLAYQIADKGRLREYQFEVLGDERVSTRIGELNTTKVKVIRENKEKLTYIWFAKDWDYLLVQLKQFEKDKQKLAITLESATVNDTSVVGAKNN